MSKDFLVTLASKCPANSTDLTESDAVTPTGTAEANRGDPPVRSALIGVEERGAQQKTLVQRGSNLILVRKMV